MDRHVLLALFIPAAFLGLTGLIKSLVKGKLLWSNFYLGIDITLTGLANGIVNIVDISHDIEQHPMIQGIAFSERVLNNAVFLLLAISSLFVVMLIHQRWEQAKKARVTVPIRLTRAIWLGGISTIIGCGVLLTFIIYRLRGQL